MAALRRKARHLVILLVLWLFGTLPAVAIAQGGGPDDKRDRNQEREYRGDDDDDRDVPPGHLPPPEQRGPDQGPDDVPPGHLPPPEYRGEDDYDERDYEAIRSDVRERLSVIERRLDALDEEVADMRDQARDARRRIRTMNVEPLRRQAAQLDDDFAFVQDRLRRLADDPDVDIVNDMQDELAQMRRYIDDLQNPDSNREANALLARIESNLDNLDARANDIL